MLLSRSLAESVLDHHMRLETSNVLASKLTDTHSKTSGKHQPESGASAKYEICTSV